MMTLIGKRHDKPEANGGQGCFCGCGAVDGIAGYIVQDSDTPKLASVAPAMCIAEFPDVPYHQGPVRIAYTYEELGLSVPAVVSDRLFELEVT